MITIRFHTLNHSFNNSLFSQITGDIVSLYKIKETTLPSIAVKV